MNGRRAAATAFGAVVTGGAGEVGAGAFATAGAGGRGASSVTRAGFSRYSQTAEHTIQTAAADAAQLHTGDQRRAGRAGAAADGPSSCANASASISRQSAQWARWRPTASRSRLVRLFSANAASRFASGCSDTAPESGRARCDRTARNRFPFIRSAPFQGTSPRSVLAAGSREHPPPSRAHRPPVLPRPRGRSCPGGAGRGSPFCAGPRSDGRSVG